MAGSGQSTPERQLNLFIALFVANHYLAKRDIRDVIEGYRGKSDEAFDRMFERDKNDLASMGIAIETGSNEVFHGDEIGYRIRREQVELPPIDFTAEEVSLLGAASRVWSHRGRAAKTFLGLRKLELGGGVEFADSVLLPVEPRLDASEKAFDEMLDALRDRRVVTFLYTNVKGEEAMRTVEPWHLFNYQGRWYLLGNDTDREHPRVFRLSRIVDGRVQATGEPGAYKIPADLDYRQHAKAMFPDEPAGTAVMRVRKERALTLRRQASMTRELDREWDEIHVPYLRAESIVAEITALGPSVVVLAPDDVRTAVIAGLRAVVGA